MKSLHNHLHGINKGEDISKKLDAFNTSEKIDYNSSLRRIKFQLINMQHSNPKIQEEFKKIEETIY